MTICLMERSRIPPNLDHLLHCARTLADRSGAHHILVFCSSASAAAFGDGLLNVDARVGLVEPREGGRPAAGRDLRRLSAWAGNQSRFSRIKYAFLQGVQAGMIHPEERIVCLLGPHGRDHFDTLTVHDLARSWSEDYPFDPRPLLARANFLTVLAVLDLALDIGALGREGKAIGTIFVVGDAAKVMLLSHAALFNPFQGYPAAECRISRPEVAESIKELAKLDGAFVIEDDGTVLAAGRHLEAHGSLPEQYKGLGSRHRSAAAITAMTAATAIAVSESSGRVTTFHGGRIIATLEPVISRRLE